MRPKGPAAEGLAALRCALRQRLPECATMCRAESLVILRPTAADLVRGLFFIDCSSLSGEPAGEGFPDEVAAALRPVLCWRL